MTGNVGNWAYLWLWENHGVGNFAATAALAIVGIPKIVKEWRAHKDRQDALRQRLDHIIKHDPDIPDWQGGANQ